MSVKYLSRNHRIFLQVILINIPQTKIHYLTMKNHKPNINCPSLLKPTPIILMLKKKLALIINKNKCRLHKHTRGLPIEQVSQQSSTIGNTFMKKITMSKGQHHLTFMIKIRESKKQTLNSPFKSRKNQKHLLPLDLMNQAQLPTNMNTIGLIIQLKLPQP